MRNVVFSDRDSYTHAELPSFTNGLSHWHTPLRHSPFLHCALDTQLSSLLL